MHFTMFKACGVSSKFHPIVATLATQFILVLGNRLVRKHNLGMVAPVGLAPHHPNTGMENGRWTKPSISFMNDIIDWLFYWLIGWLIYPSIYPSIYLSICLSIMIYPSIIRSIYHSFSLLLTSTDIQSTDIPPLINSWLSPSWSSDQRRAGWTARLGANLNSCDACTRWDDKIDIKFISTISSDNFWDAKTQWDDPQLASFRNNQDPGRWSDLWLEFWGTQKWQWIRKKKRGTLPSLDV